MTPISVTLPIRTVSEANVREHWATKARRARSQRGIAKIMFHEHRKLGKAQWLSITIVRIGARYLDSDNLARSNKAIRDGIADALGVNDGAEKIGWHYRQEIGKPYAVRVHIEAGE